MSRNETQAWLDSNEVDIEVLSDSTKEADSDDADGEWLRWQKDEGKAFHLVKMVSIYGLPLLTSAIVVVYFLNLLLPQSWRWLSPDELSGLQSLVVSVLSGVATSVAVNYFYKSK